MSTVLARLDVTAALLAALAGTGKPAGDMIPPPGWGWDHQPNMPGSTFTPFTVLAPLMASHSSGSFADPEADWTLPYLLESFGVTREQAEWMADTARVALTGLAHTTLTLSDGRYRVQQVHCDSLGATNKVTVTDPPFFGIQDGVSLWLARETS